MTTNEQTSIYDALTSEDGTERVAPAGYCYACGYLPGAQLHADPTQDPRVTCKDRAQAPNVPLIDTLRGMYEDRPLTAQPAAVALRAITEAAAALENSTYITVWRLRDEGWSWSRIGNILGVSKQAAQQRYGFARDVDQP